MGEVTKQARLDNWAMFVMNRLQIFFNTTDYCDLTLQFEGNVQLKVHRVIMNACTEYFRLLEQECEVDGDILIMPPDLQADVILPIVNFMYTGILEYQQNIFERLYQTAELMNMTVLLKFLDAQRAKTKASKPQQQSQQGKRIPKAEKLPPTLPGRKLPVWKRKRTQMPVQITPVKPYSPDTRSSSDGRFDNTPRPTRFEWPEDDMQDIKPFDMMPLDSSFDSISYSSKPLLTQEEELRSTSNSTVFDDLRQLPQGKVTKKSLEAKDKDSYSLNSSVDMEDLKSYVKEQKIRSGLADFEDEEDPDDPDYVDASEKKRKIPSFQVAAKKAKVSKEKENIIEVRATSTKVDHTKIISEVMKKYPQLAQKNKNIRLKIVTKKSEEISAEKEKPKKSFIASPNLTGGKKLTKQTTLSPSSDVDSHKKARPAEQTWECTTCTNNGEPVEFVLYYLYRKHMTDAHHKQFDARECKHCGEMYELPLQMTYHMYMAHAVAPPRSVVFPKCTRCSYVAYDKEIMARHLDFHAVHIHHVQCVNCKLGFSNAQTLKAHMQLAGHNGKNNLSFDCQYCTRQLNSATSLFVHCKTTHSEDAKRDGMLGIDDSHLGISSNESVASENEEEKDSETIEETNISSSLGPYDIVVLDNQQQFILQDDQESSTDISTQQSFMTLPSLQDQSFNISQSDIGSTDELVMVLTDHDYNDGSTDGSNIINNENGSNIVVLYSHPVDGQQNQFLTSQGNLMLNSETGMLEIHNDGVPISTQGESIEMIQKEIQSHTLACEDSMTSTAIAQKIISSSEVVESEVHQEVKEFAEEDTEKKVIAVEEEGTGKLVNTIEEILPVDQDTTDFGTQQADAFVPANVLPDEQLEPEPMDIDEEAKTATILETPKSTSVEALPEEANEVNDSSESKEEIATEEVIVEAHNSSSMTSIQPVPESEVPQDLLEPSGNLENVEIDEPPVVTECESDLLRPTTPSNEDEYKTSASLSVSEQCPEEPMEVDGSAQSAAQLEVANELEEQPIHAVPETNAETNITDANCDDTIEKAEDVVDAPGNDTLQQESDLSEETIVETNLNSTLEKPQDEVKADILNEEKSTTTEPIDEPPMDDNLAVANPPQQIDSFPEEPTTDTLIDANNDVANDDSKQKSNETKNKAAGISTLLNDWEDTDSQTSEQGKATTVNKLINDWDDE